MIQESPSNYRHFHNEIIYFSLCHKRAAGLDGFVLFFKI